MRDSLNQHTLFNTLAMIRPEVTSLLLVCEGDDDHFVIQNHKTDDMYLLLGNGKQRSLAAAKLADERSVPGVVFLIDSDYDPFVSPGTEYPPNVIASQMHDLFMDIITEDAGLLDSVIQTHVRSTVRRTGKAISSSQVREQALALASAVTPLRLVNEKQSLGLRLSDFPFGDLDAISPSVESIADAALRRSKGNSISVSDLACMVRLEDSHFGASRDRLVGDHDYFRAIAQVLSKLHDVKGVTAALLFDSFIAALNRDCSAVMYTNWYDKIVQLGLLCGHDAFSCPCRVA